MTTLIGADYYFKLASLLMDSNYAILLQNGKFELARPYDKETYNLRYDTPLPTFVYPGISELRTYASRDCFLIKEHPGNIKYIPFANKSPITTLADEIHWVYLLNMPPTYLKKIFEDTNAPTNLYDVFEDVYIIEEDPPDFNQEYVLSIREESGIKHAIKKSIVISEEYNRILTQRIRVQDETDHSLMSAFTRLSLSREENEDDQPYHEDEADEPPH